MTEARPVYDLINKMRVVSNPGIAERADRVVRIMVDTYALPNKRLSKRCGNWGRWTARVINTDKHAAYPPAIAELKADGVLDENSKHRPVQYLNNILE
jgi:transposase-like protein